MTNERLIETLKTEFRARLFVKTGWGCNQVWAIFQDALSAALAKNSDLPVIAEQRGLYKRKKKI